MPHSIEVPPKHIGLFEMLGKGKRKSELVLAGRQAQQKLPQEVRVFELVRFFHYLTPFVLQTKCKESGHDYPVTVYYRVVPPGPFIAGILNQSAWTAKKQEFLGRFSENFEQLRKRGPGGERPSASIFNLEENGELTKLAAITARNCGWVGINIFGAGLSPENRDPFDFPKEVMKS